MDNVLHKFYSGISKRVTLVISFVVILITVFIAYQAYTSSRDIMFNNIYKSNMDLAKTFRDFAETHTKHTSNKEILEDLRGFWKGLDRDFKGGFLCVIDKKGTLTLHTGAPDREGVDVGENIIHPSNPVTLNKLVESKIDYVGPYLSSAKKDQVAAFSYVPSLDSVVSIHVPIEDINKQINDSLLPWLTGLVLIAGVLLPLSLWFIRYSYASSQIKLVTINKDLADEIIERKKIEAELEEHKLNLESMIAERTHELQLSKDEVESFSYSISHDLRAPLRSISGFSQILQEDCRDTLKDEAKGYLDRILQATSKMGLLIDDMLAFSRNSQSSMTLSNFNMTALINSCYQNILDSHELKAKSIDFFVSEGLKAYGDKHLIEIAMQNILGNALKYSSQQETAVIEVGLFESGSETYTYFIRDNGIGFEQQYSHKIFKVFERLHADKVYDGTGIGLATVQKIIERHKGEIWVESEINVGTTFYIKLPFKVVED